MTKIATMKRMRVSTQPGTDSFFLMIFIDLSSLPIFMNLANLRSFRKRGMISKGVIPNTISFSPISVRNGEAPMMMNTSSLCVRTHSQLLGAIRNRIVASTTKKSQIAMLSALPHRFKASLLDDCMKIAGIQRNAATNEPACSFTSISSTAYQPRKDCPLGNGALC